MARINKTKITCTAIKDHYRNHEMWCNNTLMLRKIRKVGDTEIVNNYVLGKLREYKSWGEIDFTEERITK